MTLHSHTAQSFTLIIVSCFSPQVELVPSPEAGARPLINEVPLFLSRKVYCNPLGSYESLVEKFKERSKECLKWVVSMLNGCPQNLSGGPKTRFQWNLGNALLRFKFASTFLKAFWISAVAVVTGGWKWVSLGVNIQKDVGNPWLT